MDRIHLTREELERLNTEAMRSPVICNECGIEYFALLLQSGKKEKKKHIKKCTHHILLLDEPIYLN